MSLPNTIAISYRRLRRERKTKIQRSTSQFWKIGKEHTVQRT